MNDECGIEVGFLRSSFIVYQGSSGKEQIFRTRNNNKKMRQKLTIFIILSLSLVVLAGCNQAGSDKSKELELKEKELALKAKELELKQKAPMEGNSNEVGKPESNSNRPDGNSNKVEAEKKVEKTNPAIVTAEQVNGTWSKGESWIKIKALGSGKLNVNFSIFNERTTNAGQADGVANINGIDATFSRRALKNANSQ
jgi:hypothetical protein